MATDFQAVRALFEKAIELPVADVAAFLEREAAGDPGLRSEVESLVEHHRAAGGFLDALPPLDLDDTFAKPGDVIGPYAIVREAGRGGMGCVYMARDERLGRTVALKAIRTPSDPAGRERLRREAQAVAHLTHQGICTVYALEEIDGDLYMASEFVDGHTLRREIADGPKPSPESVLQTAREIADALASAHEAGVVHGDLKPENIMRALNGRLKILDFGLARLESAIRSDTPADDLLGGVAGTPGYMSPEQLKGGYTVRADVFAFGVVIYEFATGHHPFAAPDRRSMTARMLETDVAPLTELRPDLPASLARVVARSLRKAAADRYSSAGQIVEALSTEQKTPSVGRVTTWWRVHQSIVIVLYVAASIAAWRVRDTSGDGGTAMFLIVGIAATVASVFRGHLLFTERVNPGRLARERQRSTPATLAMDGLIAAALLVDAWLMLPASPLPAVLLAALGVGLALTRLIVEPSTTSAAFD